MSLVEECWHLCPRCGCDYFHLVPSTSDLDEWRRFCRRCVATGKVDAVGVEVRRNQMNEREQLIAALMNPETSSVVDFEASYKDLYVYGCDRAWASRIADRIIAEGDVKRSLEIMSDEVLRNGVRKLNIEHREREIAQLERAISAGQEQRRPISHGPAEDYAIRGGQPGSWFEIEDPYGGGGAEYVQSGAPVRHEMERKVRSAFAR
jgi:hypothetical protein